MATNILLLPQAQVACSTYNNQSWRDSFAFSVAGSITSYTGPSNSGNGLVSSPTVASAAAVGDYTVTLTSSTRYRVAAPDGTSIGAGVVGVPFSASGVGFTLNAGTVTFAAGDTFYLSVLPSPIDLTGIRFVSTVRSPIGSPNPGVVLSADTQTSTMVNGTTAGTVGFAIPYTTMKGITVTGAGAPYVFDVLAVADGDQRVCVSGTLAVVQGQTVI